MSFCILYFAETVAMLFMMISAVIAIIDSLKEYREEFEAEEAENFDMVLYNDFEMLYINVADGDKNDCNYWLECVKGVKYDR